MIGFSQIRDFATLVNKSRICDDDGRAKVNYYKAVNDRKGKCQERGKPYDNRGREIGQVSELWEDRPQS
ncbi:cellular nucleic acid-binding protein [Trifolium medium]|uniref:Cellular nucleic acid-binding protein n=1 Tax=Trifolium medium TaxID=97028 RepID=A0A392S5M6_9FABA|nr:cellular nucleic acid-binding protein [Trifolium medium]